MKKVEVSNRRLLSDLVRTLERQDFDYQVSKVADRFGITKQQVLTEVLGRRMSPRSQRPRKS